MQGLSEPNEKPSVLPRWVLPFRFPFHEKKHKDRTALSSAVSVRERTDLSEDEKSPAGPSRQALHLRFALCQYKGETFYTSREPRELQAAPDAVLRATSQSQKKAPDRGNRGWKFTVPARLIFGDLHINFENAM